MPHRKSLTLRKIQKIANTIDFMKGSVDKEGKEIVPNYTTKWDASTQYWMGRLRQFCEPITTKITDTRNELIKKYGTKNDKGGYDFKGDNDDAFNEEIKNLLDTEETIRFPEFKASQFVKMKDKKVEEALVPIDFWETFYSVIKMDIKEFEVSEEEVIEEKAE